MAVAKASQAISMELSWEQVAGRLLEVALEHGGADRGCLLVKRNGDLAVAASANADETGVTTTVLEPARPAAGDVVPVAVAAFVSKTRERVVLDDAAASGAFTGDPYVLRHKPRSLLCLPIVSQGEVIAVLYLENKLVSGAFTPEHLAALEVIAAQAAIALGTAELFAKLERENAERRRAEAFLEESRGKLQQIMDNSAAAIFVKDGEGRFLLANRAFNELFHLERDAMRGKTDHDLPLPPETANLFRANDLAALREDRAIEFEESVTMEEGEFTYLSVKFPLHDAEGRPYAVCGIATDITGRKRDENQLRSSVSLLRATLESTGDAIVVVDSDERAVQFNRRFVDVWGEVVAERPFDLARLRLPDAFRGDLEALARDPDEVSFDIVEFADGRIFESYSQPQRMDERVVGRVWSFRDVTVRVGAERERDRLLVDERRARAAAEQAVRVRDEFLSVASHELRTPLTSLQLAIQGLSRRLPADVASTIARNLELCRRQIRRLSGLVGLLLDASRIQAGRLELDRHVIDLRTIVRDSAAQLTEDFSRSGSALSVHVDRPVIGFWDASRMEQLSINLMTNAIKFGRQRPIEVTLVEKEGWRASKCRTKGSECRPRCRGASSNATSGASRPGTTPGSDSASSSCARSWRPTGGGCRSRARSATARGSRWTSPPGRRRPNARWRRCRDRRRLLGLRRRRRRRHPGGPERRALDRGIRCHLGGRRRERARSPAQRAGGLPADPARPHDAADERLGVSPPSATGSRHRRDPRPAPDRRRHRRQVDRRAPRGGDDREAGRAGDAPGRGRPLLRLTSAGGLNPR